MADYRTERSRTKAACDVVEQRTPQRADTATHKDTAVDFYHLMQTDASRLYGVNDEWRDGRLELMSQMTEEQEEIIDVIAVRQVTVHNRKHKVHRSKSYKQPQGAKRKANAPRDTQTQVLVRWKATVIPHWDVLISQQLGYQPASMTRATSQQVQEAAQPCEYCIFKAGHLEPDDVTACICDTCCRTFHLACTLDSERERWNHAERTDQPWACKFCHDNNYTLSTLPDTMHWFVVEWEPRWEPLDDVRDMIDSITIKQKLDSLLHNQNCTAPTAKKSHPLHAPKYTALNLTNQQKQGMYAAHADEQRLYDITHGQHIRSLLHVHPKAINPHIDIMGTGKYEVMIRHVSHRTEGVNHTTRLACVYRPCGQGAYTLSPDRLQFLYTQYSHTTHHFQKLCRKLKPKPFAEEVFDLMTRHNQATCNKEHWGLTQSWYTLLNKHTGAVKERFASPLNTHETTAMYWSEFKRDKIFGAKTNAYSCRWTGPSVAVPPSYPASIQKALLHAIRSAQISESTPTLTTLVIPAWDIEERSSYNNTIRQNQRWCRIILRIPSKYFKIVPPSTYSSGHCKIARTPGQDMLILEISNAAGRKMYSHQN